MPKIAIIYDSKSGNTEKMAKAVAEGAKTFKDVEVELHKAGTRFPISILDEADAIILGSPSKYGNPTTEMREFIECAIARAERSRLRGKTGAVFGSYAWDGGDVVDRLAEAMTTLGIELVAPTLTAVDRMGLMGVRIEEESLQKCHELGKTVAEKVAKV